MSKFDNLYMGFAISNSLQSHCNRLKVGSVIVKSERVVSNGWNGTAPGEDNRCQDENGKTKDSVIHSEMNAILKAARHGESLENSTIYCTASPCVPCSRALVAVGIRRLVYGTQYRDREGLDYLLKHGVDITQLHKES